MSSRLLNGEPFPDLTIETVGGRVVSIPGDFDGSYTVVLFYRGSWCPYCRAQLSAFSRASSSLAAAGVAIVALSVDDEATSAALVERLRLNFPVGFGADPHRIAALTGAYLADDSSYVQSTGFVLGRDGTVLTAVYSSGAIGRLVPEDVAGLVKYVDAHRDVLQEPAPQRR